MTVYHSWFSNQELPGIPLEHVDKDGNVVDLSSGWTASAKLVSGSTIVVTQTDNITLAATSPNITISKWSSATLTAVASNLTASGKREQDFDLQVYLNRTADSADEVPMSTRRLIVRFRAAAA